MKSKLLILAAFVLSSLSLYSQSNDMAFLTNYYEETSQNLEKQIKGLSEVELQFKPAENSWSISQCVEHIIATEGMIFEMLKTYMSQPENPELRGEIKFTDEEIIAVITDRSEKYKAPEVLQKAGIYNDYKEALQDFKKQREAILDYLDGVTVESLRNRVNSSPTGMVDLYQNFLFIAGHTARHTLQIEEVKNHPDFPKP